MNEMNELEEQLRSWTPRRPSAAIEASLWPAPARRSPAMRPAAWLVPLTACFLCVGLIYRQPAAFVGESAHASLVATVLSNQSYAAYLPDGQPPANNRLYTFEWTNPIQSTSPMHFRSGPNTND